ncbi:DUF456 domain-containing protein [Halostella sp. PRR32]|uniref:DUF456 domain-containing protein n=1 Tax=Halostella sp. PRR32 TaxID=3098147 RepID=UPI002B1CFDE6|nr:DUF456 domain-containing protein [Halostella sp. PRR32]
MVELVAVLAVALLVLGVVGSVVPLVPGAVLSLSGVYVYWWATGDPGTLALAAFTLIGFLVMIVDYFAGTISAKAGGASWLATALASVVGVGTLFFAGPLGALVGVAVTVFLVEAYRGKSRSAGAKAALYATVGMLGSTFMQVVLTTAMLLSFVLVVVI